jgi:hypothetical protein
MGRSAAEGIDLAQIRDAIPRYDGFRRRPSSSANPSATTVELGRTETQSNIK